MIERTSVPKAASANLSKVPSGAKDVDEPPTGFYDLPLGNLLWHLRLTERGMQRAMRQALVRTNVTKAQFGVMQVLDQIQRASSAALARTLTVSPQAMVGVIAGLESKGFIQRKPTPSTSARVLVAQITPRGRAAFAEASKKFELLDAALDHEFTVAERQIFIGLLARMRDAFDEVERSWLSVPYRRSKRSGGA